MTSPAILWKDSKQQVVVLSLSVLVIILVLAGAAFCWEYGDDYLNKVGMKGIGPVEYSWQLYMTHDGRHISPAGIIQMSLVKYLTAPPAVIFYVLLLLVSGVLITKLVLQDITGAKWSTKQSLATGVVCSAVLLIGLWPLFKDVLYWLTGGYYLLSLVQAVLLALVVLRHMAHSSVGTPGNKIITAVLVFMLSLNSQNIMLPVASVMAVYFFSVLIREKRIDFDFFAVLAVPAFLAMLVTNLAPGNFARLHREQPTTEHLGAIAYLKTVAMMYARFFNYAKIGIAGGLAFGLFFPFLVKGSIMNNGQDKLHYFSRRAFQMLVLAIISMAPFMLAPALARIRVYFYGIVFLIFAGFFAGLYIHYRWGSYWSRWNFFPVTTFLLYGIVFFEGQLQVMIPFSNKVAERKAFLETQRGNPDRVQYPLLELPDNLHLIRWADARLYGDWNKTKEYYNLGGYSEVGPNGEIIPGDIPPAQKHN